MSEVPGLSPVGNVDAQEGGSNGSLDAGHGTAPENREDERTYTSEEDRLFGQYESAPEVIPTTTERLRNRFMNEINEQLGAMQDQISIPSEVYNEYELVIFEHFLDPLFHQFSESIIDEVSDEMADRAVGDPDEQLDYAARINYEIIARFQGDINSASGERSSMGTSLFEDAASFAADAVNHIVSTELLGGARRMTPNDVNRLLATLVVSVPDMLGENRDTDYLQVMELIFRGEEFSTTVPEPSEDDEAADESSEAPSSQMQQVIDYLLDYNSTMEAMDLAARSAQERGLHPLEDREVAQDVLQAGAVMQSMTLEQQVQVVQYSIDNYDPRYNDIIINLALYSQSGLSPRRVKNMLRRSDNPQVRDLADEIEVRAEQAREDMQAAIEAIQSNLDQHSLTNQASETSMVLSTVGLMYAGAVGLTNALLFMTTGDPGALAYASLAFAGGTIAFDNLRGRESFSTIEDLASRFIFREEEIRSFNEDILTDALNRVVFWNMPDEPIEALGNPDVISQLKFTYAMAEQDGFSRGVFLTNLRNRQSQLSGTPEGDELLAAMDVLDIYFGSLSDEKADSDLYMLAHVFGQMDIDDMDDFNEDILSPNDISLSRFDQNEAENADDESPEAEPEADPDLEPEPTNQ